MSRYVGDYWVSWDGSESIEEVCDSLVVGTATVWQCSNESDCVLAV